jgi:hypothetical protein
MTWCARHDYFVVRRCYVCLWKCAATDQFENSFAYYACIVDRLCGLVVTVPGYRSRSPGLILGATRFSEKYWVWNGVHSAS